MSKCCRKNGADGCAWLRVATNVKFAKKKKKALSVKHSKTRYACISGCSHVYIKTHQNTDKDCVCKNVCELQTPVRRVRKKQLKEYPALAVSTIQSAKL